jgi:hypothetical protein
MALRQRTPLKRTPFKRKEGKVWKRLRPVSKRRQKEGKIYGKRRKVFLEKHPWCQVKGCTRRANTIQHTARRGKYYLDERYWMAFCDICNCKCEENKEWAFQNGYLIDKFNPEENEFGEQAKKRSLAEGEIKIKNNYQGKNNHNESNSRD